MPSRFTPFENKNIYHVYNKTIDDKRIFENSLLSEEFYKRLIYYRSEKASRSFSELNKLSIESLNTLKKEIFIKKHFKVSILTYCFMPTHYHLIVKQLVDNGISNFMSKTTNSFTRYFNLKNKRNGQLFLKDFKAISIRTDEQLIHTSRYIHLNMYSSGLTKSVDEVLNYPWSSFRSYATEIEDKLVDTNLILGIFNKNKEDYKKFVYANAEYQKKLEEVKYENI